MKLEDQVATREECQKINDLLDGSEDIKTAFYWRYPTNKWIVEPEGYFNPDEEGVEYFPAYTVAELGLMLPTSAFPEGGISYSWYHRNNWRGHSVGYQAPGQPDKHISQGWFESEAEARANMLIDLLESKTITPEEVIARLNA